MTPYPCYVEDRFIAAIARILPLFMVFAWIYTVSMTVKDIVYEKEKRLKEFMRVMGLSNGTHWAAWFITALTTFFIISVFLCVILKYGKILPHSEFSVR
jgi:ATP-binding cassette subfamily A (ABC1) protein 1